MEALATLNNQRQFDFQNNGIEVMDLETLQRTYKENDIYGNPVRGIYHYQVIQRMTDICRRHNLNYEVGGNLRRPEQEPDTARSGHPAAGGTDLWREGGRSTCTAQNLHHHPYSERGIPMN